MKYRVRHITEYEYAEAVSSCYNLAHMVPRNSLRQKCLRNSININPVAAFTAKREDYFGNQSFHFEIQRTHEHLTIVSESEVDVNAQHSALQLDLGISCDEARSLLAHGKQPDLLFAREFMLDSPAVHASDELRDYAQSSFQGDRPLLSAVSELTRRIYDDFTYSPESTTVATPVSEVMRTRAGVCQDFAHLQVGCLRSMGFPAKYVSGYIETLPPPGREKLVGADASHAWISVYSPNEGWFEFDPTNNQICDDQHIITAWGRDYFDVTPLRGVIFGGGKDPLLKVSVDVARI